MYFLFSAHSFATSNAVIFFLSSTILGWKIKQNKYLTSHRRLVFKVLRIYYLYAGNVFNMAFCNLLWDRVSISFRFDVTRNLLFHWWERLVFQKHVIHELMPFLHNLLKRKIIRKLTYRSVGVSINFHKKLIKLFSIHSFANNSTKGFFKLKDVLKSSSKEKILLHRFPKHHPDLYQQLRKLL